MFYNCRNLVSIPALNLKAGGSFGNMLTYALLLKTFDAFGMRYSLPVPSQLSKTEIIKLFNNLEPIPSAQTITVSANPGYSAITGSGGGTGATATATVVDGVITAVTPVDVGSGYLSTQTYVVIKGGPGSGASLVATINNYRLAMITINSGGSGYVQDQVTILIVGGGGTGAAATATVTAGAITFVNVTSHGSGYINSPTIFALGSSGRGASITPNIVGGQITSYTVNNGGSGYPPNVPIAIAGYDKQIATLKGWTVA